MRKIISVAEDFSRFPAGRFYTDGLFSGERFRTEILLPAIREGASTILIDLDGTAGYGSSFLEEAFGGLVRECGIAADSLLRRLEFKCDDTARIAEIRDYIAAAREKDQQ